MTKSRIFHFQLVCMVSAALVSCEKDKQENTQDAGEKADPLAMETELNILVLEGRIPQDTVAELKKRGHEVEVNDEWSEGRLTAATRDDPWRKAAANPRGMQGYAVGR